jgi:hypothetical protein
MTVENCSKGQRKLTEEEKQGKLFPIRDESA